MATNGHCVFAIFADGNLIAYDFSGETVWQRSLGIPKNHYGHSSSLLAHDHLLFIQFDHSEESQIIALQANTGEIVWQTMRDKGCSWASPIITEKYVLLAASPKVACYDIHNGREMWSTACLEGEVAPSATYNNGKIFVANTGGSLVALNVATGEILWSNADIDLPDVPSPVATENFVFVASSDGMITCVDANSGAKLWEHELSNGIYASPIVADDRVYVVDVSGNLYIFAAENNWRLMAEFKIAETIATTPALVKNRMFFRSKRHLICVGDPDETEF